MQYGPPSPSPSSSAEAEYYFQELREQRLRAKQLFHCYVAEDDEAEELDDYYAFYEQSAR